MSNLLDDKSRFSKVMRLLPQNFVEELVSHLKSARLPDHFIETFDVYDEYERQILSGFSERGPNGVAPAL